MRKFWIVMYAPSQSEMQHVRCETLEQAQAFAAKKAAQHGVLAFVLESTHAVSPVREPTVSTEVLQ